MRARAIVLAIAIVLAPLGATAADLVVWWLKAYDAKEDEAVREIIAAFERQTGKRLELELLPYDEMQTKVPAAIEAGHPPDFLFGTIYDFGRWAYEDRLIDLSDEILPFASLFDPNSLAFATLLDATTGRRALYALPMGFATNHVHVWRNLLEQAGFTLEDIPRQWEPFWAFWCDQVQPAVRRATGRDDVYGVGLAMSIEANDTFIQFEQFAQAYAATYVSRDGKLIIENPEIRRGLIKTIDSYTAIYRKNCTPPDAIDWTTSGNNNNNRAFLAGKVVMVLNDTLSVPNVLKADRPADYYKSTATIEWPAGADGQPLAISTGYYSAAAFKAGGHAAVAKEFVGFLVGQGWLMHYLDFSRQRLLPPIPKLLEQPFWLDPSDPHHMASAIQFLTRPRGYTNAEVSGNWRHQLVNQEHVWGKAVHGVATGELTPAQAVDEAILRIKQILGE